MHTQKIKVCLTSIVLLMGLIIGPPLAQAESDNFTMSTAVESGVNITWRLEQNTGRVSICLTVRDRDPACSHWSALEPDLPNARYMIGDSDSNGPSLWVWRMNTTTGAVSLCKTDHPLIIDDKTPTCTPWHL